MGVDFKLKPHSSIPQTDKPVLVVVIDGWGDDKDDEFNAVSQAETPCMDSFKHTAPEHWMLVKAHGTAVGLPSDADMGNSEVWPQVRSTFRVLWPLSWLQLHTQQHAAITSCCAAFLILPWLQQPLHLQQSTARSPPDCSNHLQVGHNALGSGQVVDQGASLVDQALANQEIWGYDGWKHIEPAAKEQTLHLIGLLSDGGVHSRLDQLLLTIKGVSTQLGPGSEASAGYQCCSGV